LCASSQATSCAPQKTADLDVIASAADEMTCISQPSASRRTTLNVTCALQKYWAAKNRPVASVCSAPPTIDPVGIDDNCYTLGCVASAGFA